MSNEFEILAGASADGFVRPLAGKHAAPPGTPCANCATPSQGPWCHVCGQSGEDFHRSITRLIGEVVESLLHADGRLWRTLPDLMLRPGRLTRTYLDGHRAPQIPPLRLFLVVLLAVFVVGGLTSQGKLGKVTTVTFGGMHGKTVAASTPPRNDLSHLTPQERAAVAGNASRMHVTLGGDGTDTAATAWLQTRLKTALDDPERFKLVLEQWSERFAFLMLPVAALLMSLLFVFQRRFFLFDHTIFSLHSLSAMGLVGIVYLIIGAIAGEGTASVVLLAMPVHLFLHMRGVYRSRVPGTLIRMALLFAGSSVAVAVLAVGLIAVGLNGMGG
jgi:hypothetical protein